MPHRARLAAGRDLDHVIAHEVARAVREGKAAAGVVAVPRAGLERDQIVTEVEVDRNSFTLRPFAIGIEQEWLWLGRRILCSSRHMDRLLRMRRGLCRQICPKSLTPSVGLISTGGISYDGLPCRVPGPRRLLPPARLYGPFSVIRAKVRTQMPRYYFSLKNSEGTLLDHEGTVLPDLEAARAHARLVMLELMRNANKQTRTWRLEVPMAGNPQALP